MAEMMGNFEKAKRAVHGFYVYGVKRDQLTGHYVGVVAWVAKSFPLAGSQVRPHISKVPKQVSSGQESLQRYTEPREIVQEPAPKEAIVLPAPQPAQIEVAMPAPSQTALKIPPVQKVEPEFNYADPSDSYAF